MCPQKGFPIEKALRSPAIQKKNSAKMLPLREHALIRKLDGREIKHLTFDIFIFTAGAAGKRMTAASSKHKIMQAEQERGRTRNGIAVATSFLPIPSQNKASTSTSSATPQVCWSPLGAAP